MKKKNLKKTRAEKERPTLKVFISYARAYKDYYKVFHKDLDSFTANLPYSQLDIWSDERIPLGDNWHESIQTEVAKCDIALLLVSDQFMNSKYIKEEEVNKFIERTKQGDCLVVPVYFNICRFNDWPELSKGQFFKPNGAKYGRADINDDFSYADLVVFDTVNGVKIPQDNPNRNRYMRDFIDKLEKDNNLKEIAAQKDNE